MLCPGVYSVSTPGHGGIMVRRELAEKIFRKEALDCGFTEGAYLCFEEDCDEPVALRELMDKGMYQAPVNERFAPGAYEAVINDSLQTYGAIVSWIHANGWAIDGAPYEIYRKTFREGLPPQEWETEIFFPVKRV